MTSPTATTATSTARTLVEAMRPRQATKNLFVYAAVVFVGRVTSLDAMSRATAAFLLFCGASAAVYLVNDICDADADRQHPAKATRPIASGRLSSRTAAAAAAVLAVTAVAGAVAISRPLAAAIVVYLVLQAAYSIRLKNIVLIDVFTIAAGFLARVAGGAFVISVHISHWLFLCTLLLALFLGFGKRRQELVLLGDAAASHRAILDEYSVPLLDSLILVVCSATIVCYAVYSVESATAAIHPHLWVTVPVVFYGICRYMYLVYRRGWGGAPDEVLMRDRALQAGIVTWLLLVVALLRFDVASP